MSLISSKYYFIDWLETENDDLRLLSDGEGFEQVK